jgi:hypothetical protein
MVITFLLLQTSTVSGELSTSTMTYTPRSEDSGKTLHCRATNPEMHQGVLEDQWKLDVQCKSEKRNAIVPSMYFSLNFHFGKTEILL